MNENLISSGEFAKLCDTTKETLRHYRNIGLLLPVYVADNGFQYYEADQFYDYYAISIFKKSGTSLDRIKECMEHQEIPAILETLAEQQAALTKEKMKIEEMQFVVENSIANMNRGIAARERNPYVSYFEEEHLIAVPREEFSITEEERADGDRMLIAILRKYKEVCAKYDVRTDYQLGAVMQMKDRQITHIYTKVNQFYENPYYRLKPAGKYLSIIEKGTWDLREAYEKFHYYIKEHAIQTVGDLYSYDLAGFMVNGIEENCITIISIQVEHAENPSF